jgi:RNase P/RNase MRP subunit POP5
MKSLKPSVKENKRYLLIKGKNLKKNVENAILDFIGVLGFSKCGLGWIELKSDYAIIYANREMINPIRASIGLYKEKIEVLKVSGTLKKLK